MSKNPLQKFVYIENTHTEEDQNKIPVQKENNKIEFADLLKDFDITKLPEKNQAVLKKTIKTFTKNKDKDKVEIKFDESETRKLERSHVYDGVVKDITKYQTKVKLNREADVLDFSKNIQIPSTSAKSLANNTKEMNDFEKDINDILKKEKYETDEQILKKEQEELMKINPEELKKRYEEIKKIRFLLFQKEHDSKRKAKIKSKLYHKIKKKQREREEKDLLEKLGEVDPNAVNAYLEKKNIDRIKERIELKHSFNSKFSKTVKRYNLQSDLNVKEAIKENFKLRDELLKKVEGRDLDDDEENSDNISDENFDDEEENENEESEENENEEKINKTDLLLNFDDDYEAKKDKKNNDKKGGVWGMKFMEEKSYADLKGKLKNVLEEVDSESFDLDDEDDNEINFRNKNYKNSNSNKKDDISNLPLTLEGKFIARRNNKIEIENSLDNINNNKIIKQKNNKITNDILNELNEDAEQALKNQKKDNFTSDEIKKIVEIEEIQKDEELFNKFLVQNETNKKEFLQKPKEELKDNPNFLSGWNSWAGDTKEIKAKDFLRKKRYQQLQERKNVNEKGNNVPNPHVKINNSFDKKFSNYLVQDLPRNIKNETEFDKLNSIPLGIETNSLSMYKKLIQPNIVKKIGQIIEPMKVADNTNAKKICDIIDKATKKKQRTKANM